MGQDGCNFRIFSDDIGMQFGLGKSASITMKMVKSVHSDGIALPDGAQIRALGERGELPVSSGTQIGPCSSSAGVKGKAGDRIHYI